MTNTLVSYTPKRHGSFTYNLRRNSPTLNMFPKRGIYGGRGHISGKFPGIVTVAGTPSIRPVEIRERHGHRTLIAKTYSNPDGTYRFDDLNPNRQYDVIARDEPDGVFNDVIVPAVYPWVDHELIFHGHPMPASFEDVFYREYEIVGGATPYKIDDISVIPDEVSVELSGRFLRLSAEEMPSSALRLIISDNSGLSKSFLVTSPADIGSLPPGSYLQSLFHFDESLEDETGTTWNLLGDISISNEQAKFGSALKIYSMDSNLNAMDVLNDNEQFCIDGWIWCDPMGGIGGSSSVRSYTLFGQGGTGSSTDQFVRIAEDGTLSYLRQANIGGEGEKSISTGSGVMSRGEWHHIMLTYDGSFVRLYANGAKVGQVAAAKGWINTGFPFTIGYQLVQTHPQYRSGHNGYIDEFRVVKGHPIVTGETYVVPKTPYVA